MDTKRNTDIDMVNNADNSESYAGKGTDVDVRLMSALKELQGLIGLPLTISMDEPPRTDALNTVSNDLGADTVPDDQGPDPEYTIRQIKALSSAYRLANDKEYVLKRWLSGDMEREDFSRAARRMHMNKTGYRVVFLIQLKRDLYPEVSLVIKSILPGTTTWLIPMEADQMAVVCTLKTGTSPLTPQVVAQELLDVLNTELMEQALISYSDVIDDLMQLPEAYRQAALAMEAGQLFCPDQMIFGHADLGIGRLILDVSPEVCRTYIAEELGENLLSGESPAFSAEIQKTASCFIDNNLNIAETSRQLHIHRNTLLYRLEQIQNETGLDIRQFADAMTYRISSMIILYLKK